MKYHQIINKKYKYSYTLNLKDNKKGIYCE